ncbi:MAG: DEAD/DEAH box helicase, partial [Acidimicrobiales bacterium]
MDVFKLRDDLIGSYRRYAESFMQIQDHRISEHVKGALDEGRLWPYPQIGLNPAFRSGGTIDDLVEAGDLHPECSRIFRVGKNEREAIGQPMTLHTHQVEAIRTARQGNNYVLTTGTGSGKSLGYIVPIVDHVLRTGSGSGVKAVVVYPMNALANSQEEELKKFLRHGPWGATPPVTFGKYTGQEDDETRQGILNKPPDIILTNYVMLELILTRYRDRRLVRQFSNVHFLVLDELHTYRGRQGADVALLIRRMTLPPQALLIRRMRHASGSPALRCVGTSATMSSEGSVDERRARVSQVASRLFGSEVRPDDVIGETLERATEDVDFTDPTFRSTLTTRVQDGRATSQTYAEFVSDPLSAW